MYFVLSAFPVAHYPRERPGTHCTGGWVGPRADLDRCGKSRLTGIRSPDRPARSQSLYQLSYPAQYIYIYIYIYIYLLTYSLHGAESFLRSWPVFAASQEIPCIFMEPESSLPYSQVPATRPYPEPTPSSPHDSLQLPEDPT